MNTKRILLTLVLGSWMAAGSLAYGQYGTPSGTQANTASDVIIPAGAGVSVRTSEAIDARNASEAQTYSAIVVDDMKRSSGEILVPKNSDAQLVIRKVATGGTTGSPELTLDLNSITVNGRRYIVSTEDVSKKGNSGIGKNKRTAELVGGGAVLGTLLGAIAGGGKGAVIGAVAGGGGRRTAEGLYQRKGGQSPNRNVVKFQLDQPVRLTTAY